MSGRASTSATGTLSENDVQSTEALKGRSHSMASSTKTGMQPAATASNVRPVAGD